MMKFLTVDNEVATIQNNKIVSPGSRFDGMDVKTNADIEKIFGVKVGKKRFITLQKKLLRMIYIWEILESSVYMKML